MHAFPFSKTERPNEKDARVSVQGRAAITSSTGRVLLSRRRLRTLRLLAERSRHARSEDEACSSAAAILAENRQDAAFVLIYLLDAERRVAKLAGAALRVGAAPPTIELDDPTSIWHPLRQTIDTGALQRVSGLENLLGVAPGGADAERLGEAVVLSIAAPGHQHAAGFLIAGLNPPSFLDDDYRGFLELSAGHIAAAIVQVRAAEAERKRAEALAEIERARLELAMMRREVEAVLNEGNRRKSEFLANMSHEIRSPMTAILGFADILLLHLQDPDDVECVKTIKESGNYLLEMINDILDLAKIQAGNLRMNKEPVPLQPLLREIQSLMSIRAREKGLPLLLKFEGALPDVVETDRTRLRQILMNLLSNAIKFTEQGEVQLIVKVLAEKAQLQFDVVDTGIGILPELQSRLFDAFSQGDASPMRRYGGTGLGLALSKRLVEMLDGAITLTSVPRRGSTFTVTVPLGELQALAWRDFGKSPLFAEAPNASLNGCGVLVADDRTEIRYLLRQFLEDAGGEVITAAGGLEAIDDVQKTESANKRIDVVVMDMAMPGLDGFEATRRLRQSGFDRPIIALTAAATKEDRDKCLEAGCDAYLSKPVDRQALLHLVAQYTGECDEAQLDPERGAQAERRRLKVLLVDDSLTACRSMARLLEMSGHQVRTAFDGKSALAVAQNFGADALILDIKLPDMTGYQLLKRLREEAGLRAAKSIALTGYGEEARSNDPNVNFDYFLLKPVDIVRLEALLN
jgi:signal transduction histidine kinase/CheY-like chemotaxis protein